MSMARELTVGQTISEQPAHLCAVTYIWMTEIILTLTLNNNETNPILVYLKRLKT